MKDRDGAAALCAEAGRFADDCGQHLWQGIVKAVVRDHLRSGDLVSAVRDATPVYCTWEGRLGESTDIESRFWQKLFGGFFEHAQLLDAGSCAVLEPAAKAHCEASVAQVYLRRIHMLSVADPELLCSAKPTVEALQGYPNLRARPAPLLEAVLYEQFNWACTLEEGGLPPMGDELLQVDDAPVDCSG